MSPLLFLTISNGAFHIAAHRKHHNLALLALRSSSSTARAHLFHHARMRRPDLSDTTLSCPAAAAALHCFIVQLWQAGARARARLSNARNLRHFYVLYFAPAHDDCGKLRSGQARQSSDTHQHPNGGRPRTRLFVDENFPAGGGGKRCELRAEHEAAAWLAAMCIRPLTEIIIVVVAVVRTPPTGVVHHMVRE